MPSLTKDRLRREPRRNLERCAEALGFRPGFERWDDRRLVRRVWRQLNPERKRIIRPDQLAGARRADVERLARWEEGLRVSGRDDVPRLEVDVGLGEAGLLEDRELRARVWRVVDARQQAR